MRIVSLIASSTEIVCALGCEAQLVGRSHECDYPESVRHLPVCTQPKIDVDRASADIDTAIKDILRQGLSVYHVDETKLRELRPDVIITQSQCEVCAVSDRDVAQALGDWLGSRPRLVSLQPQEIAGVWNSICQVAEAIGVPERGYSLTRSLNDRMGDIENRVRSSPARPRVACIEWIEPLMAAGNWVPELVAIAGSENLFGAARKHSPWMTFEQLRERDPDVIIVMPCGFDLARTRAEMPPLVRQPGWDELRAVKNNQVFLTDGNQYFNRPGPRLVESLEILAEILHPETFRFGHEGTGWIRLK
jgi:iron complex transport system substrate-binding protein